MTSNLIKGLEKIKERQDLSPQEIKTIDEAIKELSGNYKKKIIFKLQNKAEFFMDNERGFVHVVYAEDLPEILKEV